jgi:hypothetical protein
MLPSIRHEPLAIIRAAEALEKLDPGTAAKVLDVMSTRELLEAVAQMRRYDLEEICQRDATDLKKRAMHIATLLAVLILILTPFGLVRAEPIIPAIVSPLLGLAGGAAFSMVRRNGKEKQSVIAEDGSMRSKQGPSRGVRRKRRCT